MAAAVYSFLMCKRSRFFYFMMIFGLDTLYTSFFKLAYHDPRPYMIEPAIHPFSCETAFGNPSGHSSASAFLSLAMFLDIFHGTNGKNFYSRAQYCGGLTFALYWAMSIPYSRFLMGVHSLDQIVYGSSLGIWAALTMHFLVRDTLISHIESSGINKLKYVILTTAFYIFYETSSIMTFNIVNNILTPDSSVV